MTTFLKEIDKFKRNLPQSAYTDFWMEVELHELQQDLTEERLFEQLLWQFDMNNALVNHNQRSVPSRRHPSWARIEGDLRDLWLAVRRRENEIEQEQGWSRWTIPATDSETDPEPNPATKPEPNPASNGAPVRPRRHPSPLERRVRSLSAQTFAIFVREEGFRKGHDEALERRNIELYLIATAYTIDAGELTGLFGWSHVRCARRALEHGQSLVKRARKLGIARRSSGKPPCNSAFETDDDRSPSAGSRSSAGAVPKVRRPRPNDQAVWRSGNPNQSRNDAKPAPSTLQRQARHDHKLRIEAEAYEQFQAQERREGDRKVGPAY